MLNVHFDIPYTWAKIAHKGFVKSLENDDLKKIYLESNDKNIFISVYGKPQVGKTSLILKIIGVKEEYYSELNNKLRGQRKLGNSSTATAFIYSKSSDNNNYFNNEIVNLNDLEIEIKNIRDKIESGNWERYEPINLQFSNEYFELDSRNINLTVLDLPGSEELSVQSQNNYNFVQIIKKIHNQYIPASNIVLLFSRAEHIVTDLGQLELPSGIEWEYYNDKFRIILTYSVSAQSVKKELQNISTLNKDTYLSIFRNEIQRIENKGNKILESNFKIYPLEYANSWNELLINNPQLVSKTKNIIDDLICDLKNDIISNSTESAIFLNNMKLYKGLKEHISKKNDNYEKTLESLSKQLEKEQDEIKKLENQIKRNGSRIIHYKKHLLNIKEIQEFEFKNEHYITKTDLEEMKNHIETLKNELIIANEEFEKRINDKYDAALELDFKESIYYYSYIEKNSGLLKDNLWQGINRCFSSKKTIKAELKSKIKKITESVALGINNLLLSEIKKNNLRYHKKIKPLEKDIEELQMQYELSKSKILELNNKIIQITKEKENKINSLEKDYENALKYTDLIDEAFKNAYINYVQDIYNREVDKTTTFLKILKLYTEYYKLLPKNV